MLAGAQAALADAKANLEALRSRYSLAATSDPEAADKVHQAEEQVKRLQAHCAGREKALAEAEEAQKCAQEAEGELSAAAEEYRKALEVLAARIAEARARIVEIAEPVLEAEEVAYRAHERVRALANQAENTTGANELLSAVLRGLEWPARLTREDAEDWKHFAELLAGDVKWPAHDVSWPAPVPPRIRRAYLAEVQARLRAYLEECLRQWTQRSRP